jgi:membrane protease YdiL (CAAX protease family)
LSELVADAQAGASDFSRRLRILGILLAAVVAVGAPVLFSVLLYTPDGVSKNGLITHLLLPTADALIMLLIVLIARRTGAAGKVELAWFRLGPLEAAAVLFLPAVALLLMVPASWLSAWPMTRLGLVQPLNTMFTPEGRDLAFFLALAVRIAIVTPLMEEVFWRGFVQRALERVAGPLPALVGQAVLFASVHLPPFGGFGPALALGLVMGAWRWRRRTLVPILLAHMVLAGLYCVGNGPHWLDYSKVKVATDCIARMTQTARPSDYDPNADARDCYEKGFQTVVKMPEMLGVYRRGFTVDWPEEAFAEFRRWVAANEESLGHMARGAQKRDYWPQYAGNSAMLAGMLQSEGARDLAFAMDTRIKLRTFDGETDLLLADIATLYRFAGHFGGRKVLSHQLLGIAIRTLLIGTVRGTLACESLEPETLAALQRLLEQLGDSDPNTLDFTIERLVWQDGIQRLFTEEGDGQGRVPRVSLTQWGGLPESLRVLIDPMTPDQNPDFLGLDRRQTTRCAEEFLDHIGIAAARTPWEFRNEPNGVRSVLDGILQENTYVGLLGNACLGVAHMPWRARADLDALVVTIALIRYEAVHARYPDSLTQLVEAGFLRRVPRDPYSNGPLVYQRGEGGFQLYSCGVDLDDDGGVPSRWGDGPEGGDQVFWPIR